MYRYEDERPDILTDAGSRLVSQLQRKVTEMLRVSGAVRLEEAAAGIHFGSSWQMLAAFDRLVELGLLREVRQEGETWGQHRVFVAA